MGNDATYDPTTSADKNQSATATPADTPRLRPTAEAETWRHLSEILNLMPSPSYDDNAYLDEDSIDSTPLTRLANCLITLAIELNATDLQMERDARIVRMRVRVDGRLRQVVTLPGHLHGPLLNRFKRMAEVEYWRSSLQNGTIRIKYNNRDWNIALQTTAANYGEHLTLRIVGGREIRGFSHLGMPPEIQVSVEDAVLASGLLLIVGPADSGRTTTAFSLLNKLNDIQDAVATIEDAPTYRLSGLVQTYRNQAPARASAQTLVGSLIRQHVNVLFCGDLTDADMVEATLTSAEAGINTLACVNAPNVTAAVGRLLRLGASADRLTAQLSGTLFQVLVGQNCPDCSEAIPLDAAKQTQISNLFSAGGNPSEYQAINLETLYRGAGCESCGKTGVRGRIGLFGYADFDEEARQWLHGSLSRTAINQWATLPRYYVERDARAALWEGKVSLDELERVLRPLTAAARRVV